MNNVIFYPFKYGKVKDNRWSKKAEWITQAFTTLGYKVMCHPDMEILEASEDLHRPERNNPDLLLQNAKFVIYNHATAGDFTSPIFRKKALFFKPVGPDLNRCTLDRLGFASYITPTYTKPDFEDIPMKEVNKFLNTTIKTWKKKGTTKWGDKCFKEEFKTDYTNYALVIGQVPDDETVTHQDFAGYVDKLLLVIEELYMVLQATTKDPIVVKIHPYCTLMERGDIPIFRPDRFAADSSVDWAKRITQRVKKISPDIQVVVGEYSIHDLMPQAKFVVLSNSGVGYEAMMYRKPIISFGTPEYHWVTYNLRKLCDMWRAIDTDSWFNPEMSDRFLYWFMVKYCIYDEASTLRRVKDLLEEEKKK
jgi:hypothetical protein